MYLIPQMYQCNKCGYEKEIDGNAPNILTYYCNKCLEEFLDKHVGQMVWTIKKDKD